MTRTNRSDNFYVWIPSEYVVDFLSLGKLRMSNLSYYQLLENETQSANGISDRYEGNLLNERNFEATIYQADGSTIQSGIPVNHFYHGADTNNIFVYCLSWNINSSTTFSSWKDSGWKCIRINDITKFKLLLRSALLN